MSVTSQFLVGMVRGDDAAAVLLRASLLTVDLTMPNATPDQLLEAALADLSPTYRTRAAVLVDDVGYMLGDIKRRSAAANEPRWPRRA